LSVSLFRCGWTSAVVAAAWCESWIPAIPLICKRRSWLRQD